MTSDFLLSQEVEPVGQLWQDIEHGLREQAACLSSENRELQERLMVSEATVHAQAEQLKDYRDLLSESHLDQCEKMSCNELET